MNPKTPPKPNTLASAADEASLYILSGLLRGRDEILPQLFDLLGENFYALLPNGDGDIAKQLLSQPKYTFDRVAFAAALGEPALKRLQQSHAVVFHPKNGEVKTACETVKLAFLRDSQASVMRTSLTALKNGERPDSVLHSTVLQLNDLGNLRDGRLLVDKRLIGETLTAHWASVMAGEKTGYLRTGLTAFDTKLGGIPIGNKLILAVGIPGSGKTAFCSQVAWQKSEELHKTGERGVVVFFSAEVSAEEVIEREAARRARIDLDALEKGEITLSEADKQIFEDWIMWLSALPTMQICDTPMLKPSMMPNIIMQAKLLANAEFVALTVFDHIQKFIPDTPTDSKTDRIEATYSDLQDALKQFSCPKLVIAHQNRNSERRGDPRPSSDDIAYAGEKAADRVYFFLLPHQHLTNMNEEARRHYDLGHKLTPEDYQKACIYVTKSRRGRGYREVDRLAFEGKYYHWTNSIWQTMKGEKDD